MARRCSVTWMSGGSRLSISWIVPSGVGARHCDAAAHHFRDVHTADPSSGPGRGSFDSTEMFAARPPLTMNHAFDPDTARRVDRTFAFLDLSGFTDFIDAHGDEAAAHELGLMRAAVRQVSAALGVRVDKWLGDGGMLVGVDVDPVVEASVAIRETFGSQGELPLRAGIASGPVLLLEGDDYVGRAVNLAARLCALAEGDQILAAKDGLRVPDWIEVTGESAVTVHGFAEPIVVAELSVRADRQGHKRESNAIFSLMDGLAQPIRSVLGR